MRNANWLRSFLLTLALITSLAACAVTSGRETVGEYVDDATITTKVKAAMFDDPALKVMQIGVETMQNVVQLSGFVDSEQTKARAGERARSVTGVREVKNDLVVR
jgi:hyperosmotically inducible periplasmic protein